jgi:hypothetical protein
MRFICLPLLLILTHCSSAPEKPAAAPRAKVSRPTKAKAKEPPLFPLRCAKKQGECLPPPEWVDKLCDNVYSDLALHLFASRTPWQRLYMRSRAEPFNASGGASLMGEMMQPGEEVIALRRRDNKGEFQVGDTAGYDVLRWNGACATIHDGDFTREAPEEIRNSPIDWRRLSLELRLALEADDEIGTIYELRARKCKGKSVGQVSDECEAYDRKFRDAVANKARTGAKLPKPSRVP